MIQLLFLLPWFKKKTINGIWVTSVFGKADVSTVKAVCVDSKAQTVRQHRDVSGLDEHFGLFERVTKVYESVSVTIMH